MAAPAAPSILPSRAGTWTGRPSGLSVEEPNELHAFHAAKTRPTWRLFAAQVANTAITPPTGSLVQPA